MSRIALPRLRRPVEDAGERGVISPVELRRPRTRAVYWGIFALLVLATLTTIFPLYWMFTGAVKSTQEMLQTPPTLWPRDAAWGNYVEAWNNLRFGLYFTNTVILTAGVLFLQLFVSTLAAYSLSKMKPVFGNVVLFLFLSTLMVPGIATFIPRFLVVADFPILHYQLTNTFWAVWLPGAVNAFSIFLLKSFFDQIPQELTDAATVDGASSWKIFTRIILPLSKPPLAVVAILAVIANWQDFLWPLLVLPETNLQPISVALWRVSRSEQLNLIVAGLTIASTPMIVLFLVFQRQIIRGITLTGLKG